MNALENFELLKDVFVHEFNTRARLWRHKPTGAEVLSLENNDENKVFGITFRTPPENSTGIAHILEHSVLCGSEKYPVKEPFIELAKGSLNTFLNAFTYPDKTCYPVASTNLKDFYNLIDVYLDAVFHPLITPYTLLQEGWHYELESPDGEMTIKGVVYNEMKGDYSSPDSVIAEESRHVLFPATQYRFDSGGDPEAIPELTYAEFKRFYETHYHPSNTRIYFYGDDDPEERLRLIDKALQGYAKIEPDSQVALQPAFTKPVYKEARYDSGEDPDPKGQVTVNWLLPEAGDVETTLAWSILAHILIGTPASPLRKALIDSGLGEDLAGVGFDSDLRQMMFSTGLRGIKVENAGQIQDLILSTLRDLAEKGIDPDTVASSLNTIEFGLRESNTGSFPRGLALMLWSLESWLYDRDPIAPLAFEAPLNTIKRKVAQGNFFEDMIRVHLLANPHRATVLLKPDPTLDLKRMEKERERLEKARQAMTTADLQEIIETTRELKRRQETPDSPEALATIPHLQRSDLEPKIKTIPIEILPAGSGKILYHDLFTNGILYLDVGFDLQQLPQESLPFLPLFSQALLETGTAELDFVQLVQRIGMRTGGIYPSTFTSAVRNTGGNAAWLFLRGKAMLAQTADLLAILRDVLLTARLDNRERIRQMALEAKAGLEAGLVQAGHRVVNTRLRARYSLADLAAEEMSGINQLFFLRKLVERIDTDWESVHASLEAIRAALIHQEGMIVNATIDQEGWKSIQPQVEEFIQSFSPRAQAAPAWSLSAFPDHEGLTLPTQVNFVGKGANLYQHGYRLHGSIQVIVPYLRSTWLWDKVRVQGGAYGGFCTFDQQSGSLSFLSYRDPNLIQTLEVFDQTSRFLREIHLDENELTRAIIGAISEVDAYQLPDARGYTSMLRYLLQISDEERQTRRDEILATTEKDFRAFADAVEQVREQGAVVVVASPDAIQASKKVKGEWLVTTRVL
jgi:hypothetical protein